MGKVERVLFLGSKEIGFKSLSTLHSIEKKTIVGIITIDDSADERSVLNKFIEFSKINKIPLTIAKDRENADRLVRVYNPDLCIVIGWYWLIKKEVLDSVPYGFIGVHNSLLPKYRGGSPLVWAIINGEEKVGFTIFSFSEGIDDGPVWGQVSIEISNTESIAEILDKFERETVEFLKKIFPLILDDSIKPTPQNENESTYCSQRIPEDGAIDWSHSSIKIHNFIRAQSKPYPGAFTYIKGKKLTVLDTIPLDIIYFGTPGQIARIDHNGVWVICGDQKPLILKVVQYDSDTNLAAQDVIRSINIRFNSMS